MGECREGRKETKERRVTEGDGGKENVRKAEVGGRKRGGEWKRVYKKEGERRGKGK